MKLYELDHRRGEGIEIKVGDEWIVFDHLDGMYSYCWRKDNPDHLVHLMIGTELKQLEDGRYEAIGEVKLPPGNTL